MQSLLNGRQLRLSLNCDEQHATVFLPQRRSLFNQSRIMNNEQSLTEVKKRMQDQYVVFRSLAPPITYESDAYKKYAKSCPLSLLVPEKDKYKVDLTS